MFAEGQKHMGKEVLEKGYLTFNRILPVLNNKEETMGLEIPIVRFSELPKNASLLPGSMKEHYLFSTTGDVVAVSQKEMSAEEKERVFQIILEKAERGPLFVAGVNM